MLYLVAWFGWGAVGWGGAGEEEGCKFFFTSVCFHVHRSFLKRSILNRKNFSPLKANSFVLNYILSNKEANPFLEKLSFLQVYLLVWGFRPSKHF